MFFLIPADIAPPLKVENQTKQEACKSVVHYEKDSDTKKLTLKIAYNNAGNKVVKVKIKENKDAILPRLLNIHSADRTKDLSFKNFVGRFSETAISENLWSFPISGEEEIKDPKTGEPPTILLPSNVNREQAISMGNVYIGFLPKTTADENGITRIVDPIEPNTLIWLPKPYIIAGSFHKELYPHDTSVVIWELLDLIKNKKLKDSSRYLKIVRDQLDNFTFEIENFGYPLNGNRGYLATRSQTNNIPTNVLDYFLETKDIEWLKNKGLPMTESIFNYWTTKTAEISTPAGRGYRWIAHGEGPCIEITSSHEDHNFYYFQVLKTLVELFQIHELERPDYAQGFDYSKVVKAVPKTKLKTDLLVADNRVNFGPNIKAYYLNNEPVLEHLNIYYRLTPEYYLSDRASRTSGYDANHLYGPFNAFTYDFIAADHNLLLYRHAKDISKMFSLVGEKEKSTFFDKKAKVLKEVIMKTLWHEETGMFYEYDSVNKKLRTVYPFASSGYALWAQIFNMGEESDKSKLIRLVNFLVENLEGPEGIYASTISTGLHWDKPYTWPVHQGYIVGGLRYYARDLQDIGDYESSKYLSEVADRISIKYLIANYSDWLANKGTKVGEKVVPGKENLLTGYASGSNYTWNLTTIMYLYNNLSASAKKAFDSLVN